MSLVRVEKRDTVNIAGFAKPYLEQYLDIRKARYKAEKQDTALFLTEYRGIPNRIDASSIEKIVGKYSKISKSASLLTNFAIHLQPASMVRQSHKFWLVIS